MVFSKGTLILFNIPGTVLLLFLNNLCSPFFAIYPGVCMTPSLRASFLFELLSLRRGVSTAPGKIQETNTFLLYISVRSALEKLYNGWWLREVAIFKVNLSTKRKFLFYSNLQNEAFILPFL